ncbi:MAG: hypothetical protein MUC51_10980 [Anaerolineae bacterium]|jgi:hypothetical protein|nr:hypothetical protein [Anaerolineae bacterium]
MAIPQAAHKGAGLGIPVEVLAQPYSIAEKPAVSRSIGNKPDVAGMARF